MIDLMEQHTRTMPVVGRGSFLRKKIYSDGKYNKLLPDEVRRLFGDMCLQDLEMIERGLALDTPHLLKIWIPEITLNDESTIFKVVR